MGVLLSYMSEKMFGPERAKIAMLGLDAAGKTTILYKFVKSQETFETFPTMGFNKEKITHQQLPMTFWDFGGRMIVRYLKSILKLDVRKVNEFFLAYIATI